MAYSMEASSDNCYEGTTCLINKLDIHDEKLLAETESAYVLAKASYLDLHPIQGDFDFEHYCEIHRFLFCDLYEWAGHPRKADISKKGTRFVEAEHIQECAVACFARINALDFTKMDRDETVAEIADFYSTMNMIHPFREGNGRAQRIFFTQWLRHLGYELDFANVDQDLFMIATIRAAHGVMDDLVAFFQDAMIESEPTMTQELLF